jgi:methyltransferase (TIGR00027 family)
VREGRASKTAEHNALFRALETKRPRDRRLFDDPLAAAFLSLPLRSAAVLARHRSWRELAIRIIDNRWPGVRSSVVARTRLIDETIADVVAGVDQVVILGAGFDTRAFRLRCLEDVVVFEVDHPDTQQRKRATLDRAGATRPNVCFVPTDFNVGGLGKALSDAGFGATARTLFVWEGVTNYLTESAADATVRWCAEAAAPSHLIFTYIDRHVLTDPSQYLGAERVFSTLRRAGEEMTFGMLPSDLPGYLEDRGLILESDMGAATYRARYFGEAAQAMRGHEFYRVAHARVAVGPTRAPG